MGFCTQGRVSEPGQGFYQPQILAKNQSVEPLWISCLNYCFNIKQYFDIPQAANQPGKANSPLSFPCVLLYSLDGYIMEHFVMPNCKQALSTRPAEPGIPAVRVP
ncbi:hypothetical protein E2320_009426 [Naja naja]|nr:hypothetical protein E2320_009426 [Naja naja]